MHNHLLATFLICCCFFRFNAAASAQIVNVNDETYLLLALKKAKAKYEQVRSRFERSEQMLEENLISLQQFEEIKQQYFIEETNYQQALLRVIFDQPHIVIEKAIKYQTRDNQRRVKLSLRNTSGGSMEYQKLMVSKDHIFGDELEPNTIKSVFVSIMNTNDQTIIGQPYEIKIPELKFGDVHTVDFLLLKEDVDAVKVSMIYSNRTVQRDIYLQTDASANIVDINSTQFSQEADLGSDATFDLTLERFSATDDVYKLTVLNLPRQISYDFIDSETQARLSQVKFTQGVNTKKLELKIYLPDRDDENIVIDEPIVFYALALSRDHFEKLGHNGKVEYDQQEIDDIQGGKVKLELIPKGVGRIEVRAPSLYHEITVGDSMEMDITVQNTGTRRLDNVKISTDTPFRWRSIIQPDLVKSLELDKEEIVHLTFIPPSDVGVGAQEVKIKTEALADNRPVETENKIVRIQVDARTSILMISLLVLLLSALVVGVVVFAVKNSRR